MAVSVSVVVAVSAQAYAVPVAALSYISLVVSTIVDQSGRYKLVRDSAVVVDASVLAFGKALTDTASIDDYSVRTLGKAVSDTASTADDFLRVVSYVRAYADTYGVSDAQVIAFIKNIHDEFAATDNITSMTFAKYLADGVAMNDAFDATDGSEWAFTKGVSNVVFAADEASRQVDYVRSFSDATGGFTDTNYLVFVKSLADNTTVSDTGSLRSQGYCDFSYFAEDYVGDSRTF